MTTKTVGGIAVINSDTLLITDSQTALDFIAADGCQYNINKVALNKAAIGGDFFKLSTGLAGEAVQNLSSTLSGLP